MHRALIFGAVTLAAAGMGVTRMIGLEERVASLDELRRQVPERTRMIEEEMTALHDELVVLRGALDDAQSQGAADADLILALRTRLEEMEHLVQGAGEQLASIERRQSDWSPREVAARLDEIESGVSQWSGLTQTVSATAKLAEQTSAELVELNAGLQGPSEEARWSSMVGPVVQLAGETTVGSGVLLASQPVGENEWQTLLITSWHVVRDIRADAGEDDPPIPVAIYEESGAVRHETAQLLFHDAGLDAALLQLNDTGRIACGARLPERSHLSSMRIFRAIYAVGCPLGNDPIPTRGEVTDTAHEVDGSMYWMISAPTYIGNSGGGIFDRETHVLLGIFSKIYTHGSLRPTVVPHMGLVTPMDQIYDWLEENGYATLEAGERGVRISLQPRPTAK